LETDIVIAATAASEPILRRAVLDEQVSLRLRRPLLVIDAGLPRNVKPSAAVTVIDIDAIRERQEAVLIQRQAAVPDVERIVEDEMRAWERWYASLPLESLIKVLYREVTSCSQEAAQHLLTPGALTPAQAEHVVSRSVKRLLHGHVRRLRGLAPALEVTG
jgi:glutamyl-tRNA reductase